MQPVSGAGCEGAAGRGREGGTRRLYAVWRLSLHPGIASLTIDPTGSGPSRSAQGHVAEWLRNGLQNRVLRFNSGRGLHLSNQRLRPNLRSGFEGKLRRGHPGDSDGKTGRPLRSVEGLIIVG